MSKRFDCITKEVSAIAYVYSRSLISRLSLLYRQGKEAMLKVARRYRWKQKPQAVSGLFHRKDT
ncbi:hypothetical protein EFB08_07990 [Rufibacter latericius]|uniref:Uncharacterized protein n=1 Tax=Rufibacter latericius TaxID=2487040 RepID=A0A3M9MSS6_9BACT|nr:hypothetical protein EFB08_07990 [Rufibacter latericius]